jgi:hypothetical protein
MWRKDIGRTIDYIREREDLIPGKIGYFGFSWGGFMGGIRKYTMKDIWFPVRIW